MFTFAVGNVALMYEATALGLLVLSVGIVVQSPFEILSVPVVLPHGVSFRDLLTVGVGSKSPLCWPRCRGKPLVGPVRVGGNRFEVAEVWDHYYHPPISRQKILSLRINYVGHGSGE